VAESLISYFLITEVFHPHPQGPGWKAASPKTDGPIDMVESRKQSIVNTKELRVCGIARTVSVLSRIISLELSKSQHCREKSGKPKLCAKSGAN